MPDVVVEIPVKVWEQCQRDAERIAQLHTMTLALEAKLTFLRKRNARLIKIGNKMADAVGDHHWTMEWHRELEDQEGGCRA